MSSCADLAFDTPAMRHGGSLTEPRGGDMRDMTVLRQIAAHLDGWSNLRARVATDEVSWPSVHLTGLGSNASQLWRCVRDRWTGHLFDDPGAVGEPVATIQTTIGEDASASEVSDGIKAIYRMLGSERRAD